MSDSGNNLIVSISADSTKLRTDLKLAEASVKSLKKEFTALADEAIKTGDKTKVIEFTPKVQQAEKAVVSLRKEIVGTQVATGGVFKRLQELAHGTRPLNRIVREFGDASKAADIFGGSIGAAFGGFTGGVIGVAVAKVAGSIASMIDDTSKRLVALRQLGAEIGVKPIAAQAAQELAVKAGVSAEDAATAMQSQSKLLEEARNLSTQAGGRIAGMPQVFRGDETAKNIDATAQATTRLGDAAQVASGHMIRLAETSGKIAPALPMTYRGGTQEARDFTKPLELYQFEVKRFESSAKGMLQQQQFLNASFLQWRKILGDTSTELNVLSKSQFGVPAATGIKLAETNLKNLDKQIKELEQTSRGATDKALSDDERLRISQAKLGTQRDEMAAKISSGLLSARVAIIEFSVKANDVMTKALADMAKAQTSFWDSVNAKGNAAVDSLWGKWKAFGNWLSSTFPTVAKGFADAWTASINWVERQLGGLIGAFNATADAARSVASAAGAAASAVGAASMGIGGGAGPKVGPAGEVGIPGTAGYQAAPAQGFGPYVGGGGGGPTVYRGGSGQVSTSTAPISIREEASGGYIRGPGSSTSDSILARLSNGEFVLHAGAVRRVGIGFLDALNSFAAGGLVGAPPIRFAAGGLVASSGNAMASFHFESGSSFKLGGPVDVVNAMVSEAHAQQVRSAGVKPSWYAARPSGR